VKLKKESIKKKDKKNYLSQLVLTCQTHNLNYKIRITSYKANKKYETQFPTNLILNDKIKKKSIKKMTKKQPRST
jgi:hypothetical protein